ncbi:MAG TPA: hypothetical protein PKC68_02385 [Alphaproteobacteria bacterium]|nr:hypothetical protein [Alphaproteobacteria bacterium]
MFKTITQSLAPVFKIIFALVVVLGVSAQAQQQADIARELDKLPVFKLLVEKHPEIRDQIVKDVTLVAQGGAEGSAAQLRLNALIQSYFGRYAAKSSDASIINFINQFLAMLDHVKVKNPAACRDLATGQGASAAQSFEPALTMKLMDSMAQVIQSAITTPQSAPDIEWAQPRLIKVMQELFAKNDPNFTVDFFSTETPPANICYSIGLIYRTIQEALPKEEVGKVLRAMLGSMGE